MDKDKKLPASITVASTTFIAIAALTLVILLGGIIYWLIAENAATEWEHILPVLIVCGILWLISLCLAALSFAGWQIWLRNKIKQASREEQQHKQRVKEVKNQSSFWVISRGMRQRYGLFWRHKTRLLLITGESGHISAIAPGLIKNLWLEGNRTVLIYGGALTDESDSDKFNALRKLRRGRPLDGIIRVIGPEQTLTPQMSDNDLRGLEKIGELLHYQEQHILYLCWFQ